MLRATTSFSFLMMGQQDDEIAAEEMAADGWTPSVSITPAQAFVSFRMVREITDGVSIVATVETSIAHPGFGWSIFRHAPGKSPEWLAGRTNRNETLRISEAYDRACAALEIFSAQAEAGGATSH